MAVFAGVSGVVFAGVTQTAPAERYRRKSQKAAKMDKAQVQEISTTFGSGRNGREGIPEWDDIDDRRRRRVDV